jgi:ribose transport system substrate-binding protein
MKPVLSLFALIFVLIVCGGCGDSGGRRGSGKWKIGMSQCNLGEPWRVQMNADIKAASEKHSDKLHVIFKDAQNDTLKQRAQIEEFVSDGVDLLIVSPKEAVPLVAPISTA